MENTVITYNCRPELKRPIFIEGLPGVGAVGKVAADFLAEKLNATLLADILSEDLPTQIFLDEECVAQVARNELWFVKDVNGHDLIFLLGEGGAKGENEILYFRENLPGVGKALKEGTG